MLTYHQTAFDHIRFTPRFSPIAREWLNQLEDKHNIKLPAALREWYSIVGSTDMLRRYSNRDEPVHLYMLDDELSRKMPFAADGRSGYLVGVLWERMGSVRWSVFINGDDDPPVYVSFVHLAPEDHNWKLYSHTFSELVYAFFWDFAHRHYSAAGGVDGFNDSHYKSLCASFDELPMKTYNFPRRVTYRFYRNEGHGDEHLVIWRYHAETDWRLSASTADGMAHLIQSISRINGVFETLTGHDATTRNIIDRMWHKRGIYQD